MRCWATTRSHELFPEPKDSGDVAVAGRCDAARSSCRRALRLGPRFAGFASPARRCPRHSLAARLRPPLRRRAEPRLELTDNPDFGTVAHGTAADLGSASPPTRWSTRQTRQIDHLVHAVVWAREGLPALPQVGVVDPLGERARRPLLRSSQLRSLD